MAKLSEDQIKEILYKENAEFKEIKDKHTNFDMQLQEIHKKGKLTSDDEYELGKIKKNKLLLKDKMYEFIKEYKQSLEN